MVLEGGALEAKCCAIEDDCGEKANPPLEKKTELHNAIFAYTACSWLCAVLYGVRCAICGHYDYALVLSLRGSKQYAKQEW
jgi:hypothetical protein